MSRILIAVVLALGSCSKSDTPPTSTEAAQPSPAKDPAAARRLIAAGAVVLDVRTPDEYSSGHVPNAVNVPVQDVGQRLTEIDRLVGADKTKPVVVYCTAGSRAAKAKQQLEAAGYTQVVNGGGFDDLR